MCTTLRKFKTLLSQAKSTLSKYPTYPSSFALTSLYLACWSSHSIIICSYKHSWRAFKASTFPCWPFLPLSSSHSPCDMCHTLIGWKEAQSMCFSLSQSEPSLSLPPSWHLDRRSSKSLAYKWNPLPSLFITIIQSKAIMPNWEPKSYQFAIIIHHPYPNFITQSPLKPSWSHLEHTSHIRSNRRS